jgi:hypothetical protein
MYLVTVYLHAETNLDRASEALAELHCLADENRVRLQSKTGGWWTLEEARQLARGAEVAERDGRQAGAGCDITEHEHEHQLQHS